MTVDVKAREYERAIRTLELVDDEVLSAEQKAHLKERQKEYAEMFANIRPELEEVFKRHRRGSTTHFSRGHRSVTARRESDLEHGQTGL
jgi:predicted nucleic acid-binding protein